MTLVKILFEAIPVSFLALITVINPIGTGFTLNAMTEGISVEARKALARRITVNSIAIFFAVLVFGKYLLLFFGLSLPIIRVGGGLLLAAMGWSMLQSNQSADDHSHSLELGSHDFSDKTFYPFTFPVTVGPGCIAVTLTLGANHTTSTSLASEIVNLGGSFIGLIGTAIVCYFCYVYTVAIEKRVGRSGAQALNRLMAFVTLCIGLDILWTGIQGLLKI
jgi:multiple antibiotic resistance protein